MYNITCSEALSQLSQGAYMYSCTCTLVHVQLYMYTCTVVHIIHRSVTAVITALLLVGGSFQRTNPYLLLLVQHIYHVAHVIFFVCSNCVAFTEKSLNIICRF